MNGAMIIWLISAVVFGVVEGMTTSLVSVWMAVAAVVSAIIAALGGSILSQIVVFLLVSAILLILTIPFAKKLREKKTVHTNADRFIGAEGVVLEKIEPIENKGQIKAMGQIWSAKGKDGVEIDIGEKVVIKAIEGVRAIVEKA